MHPIKPPTETETILFKLLIKYHLLLITLYSSLYVNQLLHNPYLSRPKGPVAVDEVQQGEGHREHAEEDVGHGHVSNQDISGSPEELNLINNQCWFLTLTHQTLIMQINDNFN